MRCGHLFAGINGFGLAADWMGWHNDFHCEIDPFCQNVLKYYWPESKLYEDIKTTDFKEWNGKIDLLTGGFPCQPFSVSGRRKGSDDNRYLWPEMLRCIEQVRPAWLIGENVAGLLSMVQPGEEITVECKAGKCKKNYKETVSEQQFILDTICNDLEQIGYSVQPVIIPACALGAPHRRDRIWFIAHRIEKLGNRTERAGNITSAPNTNRLRYKRRLYPFGSQTADGHPGKYDSCDTGQNWRLFPAQPPVCSRNDGLSPELSGITFSKHRRESVKAYGNAIVPQIAFEIYKAIEKVNLITHS